MTNSRAIDAAYRAASGLTSRDDYKIFYSVLKPSWLMSIGINPGGRSEKWHEATEGGFYDEGNHDFVQYREDSGYALARPMHALLTTAMATSSPKVLCGVPHTNVSFRRSSRSQEVESKHVQEAAPFLTAIIDIVRPKVLVMIGATAFKYAKGARTGFLKECHLLQEAVPIPNGPHATMFFREYRAFLRHNGNPIHVIALAHLSTYADRYEPWNETLRLVDAAVAPFRAN